MILQNGLDKDIEAEFLPPLLEKVKHERFWHVRGPNLGWAGSLNYVMMAFDAPYWMFVGNDVEFCPGTISTMDTAAREHQNECTQRIFANRTGIRYFIMTRRGCTKRGGI